MLTENVLTVIPARSGSKRLPGKNLQLCKGKTLVQHAIDCADGAGLRPYVSTDSGEIAARCVNATVILRPDNLAKDDTPTLPVLQHALKWVEATEQQTFDWVLCLQPTSPLRASPDVILALTMTNSGATSVVSVRRLGDNGFVTNGAIYLVKRSILDNNEMWGPSPRLYVMPQSRSIDVNTAEDLATAERLHV